MRGVAGSATAGFRPLRVVRHHVNLLVRAGGGDGGRAGGQRAEVPLGAAKRRPVRHFWGGRAEGVASA